MEALSKSLGVVSRPRLLPISAISWSTFFLVVTVGVMARMLACVRTDLQIDEIFTLRQLTGVGSALGALAPALNNENNHLLNSLYCLMVGRADPWVYRLPSLLAGIACIPTMYFIARNTFDLRTGWAAATLAAFSYPLIYYAAEARGYALSSLCGLVAFGLLVHLERRGTTPTLRAGFWFCCLAGLLAHFTFILVLIGVWIGESWQLWRRNGSSRGARCLDKLSIHLPVLGMVAFLYFLRIRQIEGLGGPIYNWLTVATWTLAESINLPLRPSRPLAWIGSATVITLVASGLKQMNRSKRAEYAMVLLTSLITVAPLVVIGVVRPVCLYPRYFFVLVPFLLLALGYAIAAGSLARPPARVAAYLFVSLYLGLGAERAWSLLARGKSHYSDVLAFMAQNIGARDTLRVSGLKPWPIESALAYYRQEPAQLSGGQRIEIVAPQDLLDHDTAVDFMVLTRDTVEFYGAEPESFASFRFGAQGYDRCFYHPSADRIEADWIVYCPRAQP